MAAKGNLIFISILFIMLGNMVGILRLPLAAYVSLLLVVVFTYGERLRIIYKTLPRDLKGVGYLVKARWILRKYERSNWSGIDLFRAQLRKHPEKVCIYFEDQKWTFQDIEEFSNRVANVFSSAGFGKNDVVALLMGNCPEFVCFWLGLGKIGVVTALINTNIRNGSLIHCLRVASARAIIFSDDFSSIIEEISTDGIVKYQFGTGSSLKALLHEASTTPPSSVKIGFRDKCLYIYTSGTTGLPKPAIILHHRAMMMALAPIGLLGVREDDIVYNPLPLYHTSGGIMGIMGTLYHGYSVVIRKKFSASSYWLDCIKYNCTAAIYIGEMCRYVQMVPPRPEDTAHKIRLIYGNGMRPNIMEAFRNRFKIERILEIYGSTEGNTNIVNIDKKLGAVGFLPRIVPSSLLPLALIRIDEEGHPVRNQAGFCIRCSAHEPGMIIGMIRQNDPTREYHGYVGSDKENQKKIIENVFKKGDKAFLSGDILIMDELGYLYFKDRTGDTFRWKGENVSTTEVEEIISAVIGLREVTVYGVEVGNLEGRAGMAAIVDPEGETDLQLLHDEVRKRLPPYARPLFIRLSKEADMTGTFKLKKFDLQKEGFNPSTVKDKLFFNSENSYTELTQAIHEAIITGQIRV